MNNNLFAAIISTCLALFNLYLCFQGVTIPRILMVVIWLYVAIVNFKQIKAYNDKNSENNA